MTTTPRTNSNWINTNSGIRFHPFDARPEEVSVGDIAHALSRQCRYAGHTPQHYSVAEHSVHAAECVRLMGGSIVEQRWALLHDATEAYLVDLPNPVKRDPRFSVYVEIEDALAAVIMTKFGLPTTMPPLVAAVDKMMLSIEVQDPRICASMHDDFRWALPVFGGNVDERLRDVRVSCWAPEVAKRKWLAAAGLLGLLPPCLIGIGHRKRSGKDTAANVIVEHANAERIAFADLLKEGVNLWHGWDSRHSDGELKEVVDQYWGYSPRDAYVRIGTDCIRNNIRNDFWVHAAMRFVQRHMAAGRDVVITDVRFPNEVEAVRAAGGTLWKVNRASLPPLKDDDHVSETALAYDGWQDTTLDNDGSLGDFQEKVLAEFRKLKDKAPTST
jgi:hypothetical protein